MKSSSSWKLYIDDFDVPILRNLYFYQNWYKAMEKHSALREICTKWIQTTKGLKNGLKCKKRLSRIQYQILLKEAKFFQKTWTHLNSFMSLTSSSGFWQRSWMYMLHFSIVTVKLIDEWLPISNNSIIKKHMWRFLPSSFSVSFFFRIINY